MGQGRQRSVAPGHIQPSLVFRADAPTPSPPTLTAGPSGPGHSSVQAWTLVRLKTTKTFGVSFFLSFLSICAH